MYRCAIALLMLLTLAPAGASAAPYPAPTDAFVTDLAEVLSPEEEARLRAELGLLLTETGTEVSVVTIVSRADYDASPSLEAFATGLFNDWGIGDIGRNDGILILVVAGDREARLELGDGYNQGYDVLAQDIVNRHVLPEFRDGDLARGIIAGAAETVARIALRGSESRPAVAQEPEGPAGSGFPWIPAALFGAGAVLVLVRRRASGGAARAEATMRTCPNCGRRGPFARVGAAGCPHCGVREEREPAPRREARTTGDAGPRDRERGGGRSTGGGASGRW